MRPSKRRPDELRPVSIERAVSMHAEGSCLIKFGSTHVHCTASLEERMPPWLKGQGRGWVTAEYGMLPRATTDRTRRESTAGHPSGRTQEIQRLIGRALRAVVDLPKLGERQITVDCDVIQADGGTRTAAITGGWVALHDCLKWMQTRDMIREGVLRDHVAAVSCGLYKGTAVLRRRRQLRHDGRRRHRRSAGHGGNDCVQSGRFRSVDGIGQEGHSGAGVAAEADGGVSTLSFSVSVGMTLAVRVGA
jgi:ribonuclease PH